MAKTKLTFRLHKTAIILICLALMVCLLQGVSYFSRVHQQSSMDQFNELAYSLAQQVAFNLSDAIDDNGKVLNKKQITANLAQLTTNSRILDATVYQDDGVQIAGSGESITVRDRLALDGQKAGSYFNHQIVAAIPGKKVPKGFLRLTIDTHRLATESTQVDNTTNLLRVMLLLALGIGFVLANNLLQLTPSRWQQSLYLLTANLKNEDEKPGKKTEEKEKGE
ncbi:TPA: YtjB family periplasmic protein [Morganella morganii]|uniref:YtjB family periplasmic protein n=1 Tax=Morganella morganii TaxID=582 RepID=UPI00046AA5CF|nr:YtjB family periplasmic protein [Morganella morganii]HDF2342989.1 YtjB family periplasmic protein [Morganella morganii]